MSDKNVVVLSKPIKGTDDKDIEMIELREPTANDLIRHGMPVDAQGNIEFKKAFDLAETLSGIQLPVLKQLSAKDTMKVIGAIAESFAADEESVGN